MCTKPRVMVIVLMMVVLAFFPEYKTQSSRLPEGTAVEGESVNVDLIGHIGGKIPAVAIQGEYAYVANSLAGLIILKYYQTTTLNILADNPDPSLPGQPITVTFSVSTMHGSPPGIISITVSGDPASCSAELSNGMGSC